MLLPEAGPSLQSKETDLEVGRWGEELVYRFLVQHQKESAKGWEVLWVNQAFNTGTPYDIHLRGPDGTEQFIEVKSSLAYSKNFFEMSHQELDMARRLGNQYSLYRVTGVGSASPTLLRIMNPIQKWAAGQIKSLCCGVIPPVRRSSASRSWLAICLVLWHL